MGGVRRTFGQARDASKGSNFLDRWKENGEIVVFLHTNTGIGLRRQHVIPYVDVDDKGNSKIAYMNFVCLEDPENYDRENPVACPIEMFMSYLINNKNIADDQVVWEAAIGSKADRTATKAEFIGEGTGKDGWKNSFESRSQCVLAVIEAEHPERGIQIATESFGIYLGLNRCIEKEMKSRGDQEGNPEINPYALRFIYDKHEAPARMYDVAAYLRAEVTPQIQALLDSPAKNIDKLLQSHGLRRLREIMESCIQIPVNFDLLFAEATKNSEATDFDTEKMEKEATEEKAAAKKTSPLEETKTATKTEPKKRGKKKTEEPTPPPPPAPTKSEIACETCLGVGKIGKKGTKCPDCDGTGYVEAESTESPTTECETCGGIGTIGKKKTTCPDCGGSGMVAADDTEGDDLTACFHCNKMFSGTPDLCPFCGAEFDWSEE